MIKVPVFSRDLNVPVLAKFKIDNSFIKRLYKDIKRYLREILVEKIAIKIDTSVNSNPA